jgi:hypothetical protein
MPVQDATAANVALWAHYLDDEWGRLLGPFGQMDAAHAMASAVAGWLAILTAPQIAWLYEDNAAVVSQHLAESRTRLERHVIPEDFRATTPPAADSTPVSTDDAELRDPAISAARS